MKITTLYTATIFSILTGLLMSSCGKPGCSSENAVFNRFDPGAKEYQDELCRLIRGKEKNDLRFWISDAIVKNSKEQIVLDIHGKGVCAKMTVQNLTDKKFSKGGYKGAELLGTEFTMKHKPNEVQFNLRSFLTVID